MDWLNIRTSTLDAEEVVGADPIERATWLFLLRYCVGQENGGTIVDCSEWSDRKWQQLCRITLAEVKAPSRLWTWWQNSLLVWSYPMEHQDAAQRKRAQASHAALTKWKNRMKNGDEPPKPRKYAAPKPRSRAHRTEDGPTERPAKPATQEAGVSV